MAIISKTKDHREKPWLPFSELLMDWEEEFHNLMLSDKIRMVAYESAIKSAVKPGDIVLDIGTGTGILSKWALEAGASKVFAIELDSKILEIAINNMSQCGFSDRFVPLHDISFNVKLPEKVDVVISEIIGNLADNEDFQPILKDAFSRFLRPGGIMIPQSVSSYIAPVSSRKAYNCIATKSISTLNSKKYSLDDLMTDKKITNPFNIYYDTIIPHTSYLAKAVQLKKFDGNWDVDPEYTINRKFTLAGNGEFTGFKGYFIAKLYGNIILDISGDDYNNNLSSVSWKHAFLPIKNPVSIMKGDRLYLKFSRKYPTNSSSHFRQMYRWKGRIERGSKIIHEFDQNMDESILI